MKVLVAEGNRASRILVEKILRLQGYEVQGTDDGKKALEMSSLDNYDVILLDWKLPRMSGIDAAKRIKDAGSGPGKGPYVIMMVSQAGKEDMLTVLESGTDDFISKPIDSAVLASRMKVVERHRMEMTSNAISMLMEEHIALTRMSRILEYISGKIGTITISKPILEWLSSTAIMLDTDVHHRKEDVFVMIFLERVIKEHGETPKSRIFSRTSLKTIEDEHEEIKVILADIQTKVRRYLDKEPASDMMLKKAIDDYNAMLKKHMEREDKYLFPLSFRYLTEDDMGRMLDEFQKIELAVGIKKIDKRLEQIIQAEKALNLQPLGGK